MSDHGLGNLATLAFVALFFISAIWKRATRGSRRVAAERTAATAPIAPRVTAPAPAAPRLRLAPQALFAPARPAAAPPVEAAAAFPGLDLLLPDAAEQLPSPAPWRVRGIGTSTIPGRPGWGAGAVVALEVLGPPVSLRSGATLGAPHAF
jgi:hypothetical protein